MLLRAVPQYLAMDTVSIERPDVALFDGVLHACEQRSRTFASGTISVALVSRNNPFIASSDPQSHHCCTAEGRT